MTDFSQTARDPTGDDLMQIALTMAERGLGLTAPNPSVGAVLWRPDLRQIVGRGTTQPGGRPHAEPVAIAAAGDLARGATMAVTLEPCSHTGRSPPCVNAILKAGVARVIVAIPDPDARVSGRGIAGLVAAGVDVVRASANLADRAAWITRGHILRVTERRPFIRLKMAVGPEGSIAEGNSGTPTWVTSPAARASGHLLRAMADAILVGAGTLRDDDPDLTCRLPGLEGQSPIRVVVGGASLPFDARLRQALPRVPVIHYAGRGNDTGSVTDTASRSDGFDRVRILSVEGRIWLPEVITDLVTRGVTRLLVEGGPRMWQSFADLRMIDEIVLYHAGLGHAGARTVDGDIAARAIATAERYCRGLSLSLHDMRAIGPDMRFVLRPVGAGTRPTDD
ncbi:MAG: bifunctional diaminohydroxyphosphoribosylaminopyrimidine deaminase/5-amino-6-(5-phosphoribosylamino)uracil reductase RibD [Pseudomonadota bacterium]